MPAPTPVTWDASNPVVQITEQHSVGDFGWSEVYYIYIPGGTNPLDSALARHGLVVGFRKNAIPAGHVIESMRASDVAIFGDAKPKFAPEFNLGPGSVADDPCNPALGYFMAVSDQSGTISETRIYRGWYNAGLIINPDSPRSTVPIPLIGGSLNSIATELRTERTALGVTTRYVQKSFLRPESPGGPPRKTGMRASLDATNHLQFITGTPLPDGWEEGMRLHVRTPRMKCVRGVSGVHYVTSITENLGVATIVTSTVYQCGLGTLAPVIASAFKHVPAFYPIAATAIAGAGKRDTGRPFYLTRGRRLNRV